MCSVMVQIHMLLWDGEHLQAVAAVQVSTSVLLNISTTDASNVIGTYATNASVYPNIEGS